MVFFISADVAATGLNSAAHLHHVQAGKCKAPRPQDFHAPGFECQHQQSEFRKLSLKRQICNLCEEGKSRSAEILPRMGSRDAFRAQDYIVIHPLRPTYQLRHVSSVKENHPKMPIWDPKIEFLGIA